MYTARCATMEEFFASREQWNALAASIPLPSIFCTWEWIRTWWEFFGQAYEPVILFVYQNEALKGILPLAARKRIVRDGWLVGNVVTFCSSFELYPDHLDVLAAPGDAQNCMDAILNFLSSSKRWDVCRINFVAQGSNIFNWYTSNKMNLPKDVSFLMHQTSAASYIPLSDQFETYLKSFDKKEQYNLRSRNKKLQQQGFTFRGSLPSQAAAGIDVLWRLHNMRSVRKGLSSTFGESEIIRFHKAFASLIEKNNWLSLRFLDNDKEIIAASYNFQYEGRIFSYQKGLDPRWERLGPGKAIIYEAIQEAFACGLKEYNFLQGNEEYKNDWARDKRSLYHLVLYNRTVPAHLSISLSKMNGFAKKLCTTKALQPFLQRLRQ